jgi:flagellar motor switch protein FliM
MTQALDDRQLLMRLARRAQRPSAPPAAASDYDFSAPACYTRQQLSQLAEPAAAAAAALGKALSGALRRELAVEYVGVSQHYWAPLSGRLRDGGAFCLPLASGNRLAGLVLMPAETAMGWVGAMLGGPAGSSRTWNRRCWRMPRLPSPAALLR